MPLDLAPLLDSALPPGTKGLPFPSNDLTVREIADRGWSLLAGDLVLPAAVLKTSALTNNVEAMQAYVARSGVQLAPHGKTTLSPQLFERQLEAGAWAITVATVSQLALCHRVGVPRVLIANEVVGPAETALLARLSAEAPDREYLVLIDSREGAEQIQQAFTACPEAPAARVLIEVGMTGGRCGVRTLEEAVALARAVAGMDRIELHGVEGYEGLIVSTDPGRDAAAVDAYLALIGESVSAIRAAGLFAAPDRVILTAGGSVYYDLVARAFIDRDDSTLLPVLRSGCYLTHDSGFYHRRQKDVVERLAMGAAPDLKPALEVWCRVLSRPEPGRAILTAGKRDVSFDIDLPVALHWFRPGVHTAPQPAVGWTITQLSDQHAFAQANDGEANDGEATAFEVGDLVGLGISHPCTTFDKWPLLFEVDDAYRVIGGFRTCF